MLALVIISPGNPDLPNSIVEAPSKNEMVILQLINLISLTMIIVYV